MFLGIVSDYTDCCKVNNRVWKEIIPSGDSEYNRFNVYKIWKEQCITCGDDGLDAPS